MKWNWKGIEMEGTSDEFFQVIGRTTKVETNLEHKPVQKVNFESVPVRRRNKFQRWTVDDVNYLVDNWRRGGIGSRRSNRRVARILHRNMKSCTNKIYQRNLILSDKILKRQLLQQNTKNGVIRV